jgi:hypothetical protein
LGISAPETSAGCAASPVGRPVRRQGNHHLLDPGEPPPLVTISGVGGCLEIVFGFVVMGLVAVHVSKGPAGE